MQVEEEKEMIELTICTPTYNRAYCLSKLYLSLCEQTNKNFEWLIIDDGSVDETEEVVSKWIKEDGKINIRYVKKENGGKHTAINCGVETAIGDKFFIVDSDDYLIKEAVEIILEDTKKLPSEGFAGVGYNRIFSDNSLIGETFEGEFIDATVLDRPKYRINGDKAEVYFTDILLKYPFPVFEGEKYLTEAIVWNRIARDGYRLRWFNKGIYVCEYRQDGLSMNASNYNNFEGYTLFIRELVEFNSFPLKEKIRWVGVYVDVAVKKGKTYKEIVHLVDENIVLIIISRIAYLIKRSLIKKNRKEKYRVTR